MNTVKPTNQSKSENEERSLLLNEKEAARFLGVSVHFLRLGRCKGAPGNRTQTPLFVKLGGRVYYKRPDLIRWFSELETKRTV